MAKRSKFIVGHIKGQCEGKRRHPDQHSAHQAMLIMQHKTGHSLNVYECYHCSHWHIGRDYSQKLWQEFVETTIREAEERARDIHPKLAPDTAKQADRKTSPRRPSPEIPR